MCVIGNTIDLKCPKIGQKSCKTFIYGRFNTVTVNAYIWHLARSAGKVSRTERQRYLEQLDSKRQPGIRRGIEFELN